MAMLFLIVVVCVLATVAAVLTVLAFPMATQLRMFVVSVMATAHLTGDESLCGFVLIEAGTFTMGSPESERGRYTDETQHQVTLTNDFYMSDHEVTQAEWWALIGSNPSQKNNGTCDTCPVETVNWWEALHYANALSESEG